LADLPCIASVEHLCWRVETGQTAGSQLNLVELAVWARELLRSHTVWGRRMQLSAAGQTNPGPRVVNEDALFVDVALGLLVVADGMGGHNAGEVASRLAVETVAEFIRSTHKRSDITWPYPFNPNRSMTLNRLEAALRLANRRVHDAGASDQSQAGMGTTIVAALVEGDRIAIGHVGDSRAYLLRDGHLQQKTEDHTWVNAVMGSSNRAAMDHPYRHVLTNGIGLGAELSPALTEDHLRSGDRWLMCTDGVHGSLDAEALQGAMSESSPESAAQEAVRRALDAGTTDNATAVVLSVT
jgi:protein phosphatase